jgi:hypothetical protein
MKKTTKASTSKSRELLKTRIRANAQEAHLRGMSMDYTIRYVHEYLLARLWYTTQIYAPPDEILRQLNTTISWFIWQGVIFRVTFSTLQTPKEEGWRVLINSAAKCLSLFIYRLREQGMRKGIITADWMKCWGQHDPTKNPSYEERTPKALENLHKYDMDSACVGQRWNLETPKAYKKRLYTV